MNKLELLKTKLEQARKELNDKGYHYDPELYSKGGYNELMKIKPFEIKYQDVIEEIWPDEAWWKVTNYWDIFDAMAFGGFNDETVIDEIVKHVDSAFLDEAFKIEEGLDKELKELEIKYGCKFEEGHTHAEYEDEFGDEYENGELWDFSLEDIKTGAVEPQKGLVYWLIADRDDETRVFETTEFCEECSESCKSLKEGTSNFGWLRIFPLLVFYTYDEIDSQIKNSNDYPNIEQFTTDKGNGDFHVDYDAYYDACDKFEQDYWDKIDTCVLDEDQVEALEDAIYNFNEETQAIADKRYEIDDMGDYYDDLLNLEDIKVSIEPGYYEAAYISVPEKNFSYLRDDKFKEEQLKRFHDFFDKLKKDFGLSHYEVAWGPASNGETGYKKVESLKEEDAWEKEFKKIEKKYKGKRAIFTHLDDYTDVEELEKYEGQPCDIVSADILDGYDDGGFEYCYWTIKFDDGTVEGGIPGVALDLSSNVDESLKEEKVLNKDEFVTWHDAQNDDKGYAKIDRIYKIFKDAGSSEEEDVDVSYDKLSDEDKIKVTNIVNEDASSYEDSAYDKIVQVLDDYGILYGDVVDYDYGKINIVGVDSEEWEEAQSAIESELGYDVDLPTGEGNDDELVVHVTIDESKKKDCHVNTNAGDPIKNAEFFNASMGTSGEGSVGEELKEELTITADNTNVIVHDDASVEVSNDKGVVSVSGDAVSVNTEDASVVADSSNISVDVSKSEEISVENTAVDVPEVAVDAVSEPQVDEIAPVEAEVSSEEEIVAPEDVAVQEESLEEEHVCEKCGKNPCECDKQELKEEPVYDLSSRYDARNSFYGKAKVDVKDDGSQILYSYNTPVCVITKDGDVKLLRKGYLGWFSSQTTLRHVKEFLKQNGKEVGTKNELNKMYPTEDAYDYVR